MNLCILIGTFTSAIFFFFCFSYLFRTQNECRSVFSAVLECHFNIKKKYIECSFANEFIATTTIKKNSRNIYTKNWNDRRKRSLSLWCTWQVEKYAIFHINSIFVHGNILLIVEQFVWVGYNGNDVLSNMAHVGDTESMNCVVSRQRQRVIALRQSVRAHWPLTGSQNYIRPCCCIDNTRGIYWMCRFASDRNVHRQQYQVRPCMHSSWSSAIHHLL